MQERGGEVAAGVTLGNDQIGTGPCGRAKHRFVGGVVPFRGDAHAETETSERQRTLLEPREGGGAPLALAPGETAATCDVSLEMERLGNRLEQHELGIEGTRELPRLLERGQRPGRRILDGHEDASDAPHA